MFFVCVCVFVPVPVHGFETEEQFENFVRNDPQSRNVLAAVVFEHHFTHDDEPLPQQVKCSVHTDRQFQKITLFLQRFTRSTCYGTFIFFLKFIHLPYLLRGGS